MDGWINGWRDGPMGMDGVVIPDRITVVSIGAAK